MVVSNPNAASARSFGGTANGSTGMTIIRLSDMQGAVALFWKINNAAKRSQNQELNSAEEEPPCGLSPPSAI
jgi:hypothetical protein